MGKFKCEYCEARPTTTHGEELLCYRHYAVLYGEPIIVQQVECVPKTPKEKELNQKYMLFLCNHNFVDHRKTEKMVKAFLKDVKNVIINNPIYH